MSSHRHRIGSLILLAVSLVISMPAEAATDQNQPVSDFAGLWAARRDFTPELKGRLRISRSGGHFRAEISGYTVEVTVQGRELEFGIPGDLGRFRGVVDGTTIKGHWIQPRTQSNFAPYASPVHLRQSSPNRWQGEVTPLDDTLHFFLRLDADKDGYLQGFIRNPEANIGRFYAIDAVVRENDGLKFMDGRGRVRLEGLYHENTGQLSIFFPYNGGTYDFVRADDDLGKHFFPRPKSDPPYEYARPVPGEGWETATLKEVGIEENSIEALIRLIIDTPMDGIDAPYVHGILMSRHGKLVLEEYFHGYTSDIPHGTRSASKTITATLAGIAINEGSLSLDSPVYATMLDDASMPALDERARRMTLENLVSMTSGLACDDFDGDSPGQEDTMQSQDEQPDWFQFTLDLEMVNEPGDVAAYCSGGMNLAGGVVARATGEWLPDFFRDHFAAPLGMGLYHMNLSPTGEGYGGGGLLIKGRDFLKLGQLYLDRGKWQGKQVVSEDWATAGTSVNNMIGDEGYGYGWWVFSYLHGGREISAYYAGGNGGQYVIVIPDFDLNIVIFAGNYNQRIMHKTKYEYVRDYVLPALDVR